MLLPISVFIFLSIRNYITWIECSQRQSICISMKYFICQWKEEKLVSFPRNISDTTGYGVEENGTPFSHYKNSIFQDQFRHKELCAHAIWCCKLPTCGICHCFGYLSLDMIRGRSLTKLAGLARLTGSRLAATSIQQVKFCLWVHTLFHILCANRQSLVVPKSQKALLKWTCRKCVLTEQNRKLAEQELQPRN